MKKRIAFLVPSIINCGPLNVVLNLVANLDKDKFDIMLISLRKSIDEDSSYINLFLKECVLGIKYLNERSEALVSLSHELDIIHSHGLYPDMLLARLKNNKVKKVSTIHIMPFKDYPQEHGFIKGKLGALLHIMTLNLFHFDAIVSCSDSVRKNLYSHIYTKNRKRLFNVNNGVDQSKYCLIDSEQKTNLRKKYGFDEKNIFVFSGRLIPRKQVPQLIHFFKSLKLEDSRLLILGDGEEMEICKKAINEQISLIGHVKNTVEYYQLSDFVVSMANAEGYPMSILEAVSCGCYAFLSDIPPHKEFIELNPQSADSIDNLTQNVLHRKVNPDDLSRLSVVKMVESYTTIYQSEENVV